MLAVKQEAKAEAWGASEQDAAGRNTFFFQVLQREKAQSSAE